jgi:hypothetical protein
MGESARRTRALEMVEADLPRSRANSCCLTMGPTGLRALVSVARGHANAPTTAPAQDQRPRARDTS